MDPDHPEAFFPPPLPEFYSQQESTSSSESSSSTEVPQSRALVRQRAPAHLPFGAYRDPSGYICLPRTYPALSIPSEGPSKHESERPTLERRTTSSTAVTQFDMSNFPPPPPSMPYSSNTRHGSPFAVYQICRICYRPRSIRFHRENPVPVGGVPPPPGICRRCRVTEVTHRSTSEVRLGVKALARSDCSEDYERPRHRRRHRHRRERSRSCEKKAKVVESPKIITYRYVKIDEDGSVKADEKVECESKAPSVTSKQTQPAESTRQDLTTKAVSTTSSKKSRPAESSGQDRTTKAVSTTSSKRTQPAESTRQEMTTKAMSTTSSTRKDSKAMEPVVRTTEYINVGPSERDIRRIAHEEIARYREAERKLERHSDAFAYGRLVPVERESRQPKRPESVASQPSRPTSAKTKEPPKIDTSRRERPLTIYDVIEVIEEVEEEPIRRARSRVDAARRMAAHPDAYAYGRMVPVVEDAPTGREPLRRAGIATSASQRETDPRELKKRREAAQSPNPELSARSADRSGAAPEGETRSDPPATKKQQEAEQPRAPPAAPKSASVTSPPPRPPVPRYGDDLKPGVIEYEYTRRTVEPISRKDIPPASDKTKYHRSPPQRHYRESTDETLDSNHVHFASQIDVNSPPMTLGGLPRLSRRQLDGHGSDEQEEQRGRRRSPMRQQEYYFESVSERDRRERALCRALSESPSRERCLASVGRDGREVWRSDSLETEWGGSARSENRSG